MSNVFIKDPDAILDYKFDWAGLTNNTKGARADWLGVGETISSYDITPSVGITVDSHSVTDNDTSVTVWLSGGEEGVDYIVVCRVSTTAGRTDDRTITISVINR